MAAVPISQIPNAPQGAGPVLQDRLPGVSPLQPLNLGGDLDASGLQKAQSLNARGSDSISQSNDALARATAANKRDLIDPAPFVRAAGAGEFVGQALQHAGAVTSNFVDRMMEAKDTMDMSRVDAILRGARDQHQLDIEQNQISPDQWVPSWNASQPEVMKQIQALKVSPRISGKVDAYVSQSWAEQTTKFAISATKQSLSDAQDELSVNINKAFDDGDWEGASVQIDQAVKSRILSKPQGQKLYQQLETKQRDNLVNTAVAADPKAVLDDMEAARTSGQSEAFPWLDASQRLRVESVARSGVRQIQENSYVNADASIQAGEFTTPEQIEKFGQDNDWGIDKINSYKAALVTSISNTPQGQAKFQQNRSDISTQIANYDPETDPKDQSYWAIKDRINREMPTGYREEFLTDLKKRRDDGMKPVDQLNAAFSNQIKDMAEQGLLGSTGRDDKGKITNPQAALDLAVKSQQYKAQVSKFLSENPNISAEDAKTKFTQIFSASDPAGEASRAFMTAPKSNWFDSPWLLPVAPIQEYRMYRKWQESKPSINDQIDQKLGKPMSGLFNGSGKNTASANTAGSVPEETVNFIKGQEGFMPNAFSDYAQTSIGYGTRAKPGEKSISKEEADARLKSELATHATNVDKAIAKSDINLTPNQRAALISFDFNTGAGAHLIETSHSADEIAARLPTWNKVTEGGKKVVSKGLVNRRAAEMELFNA